MAWIVNKAKGFADAMEPNHYSRYSGSSSLNFQSEVQKRDLTKLSHQSLSDTSSGGKKGHPVRIVELINGQYQFHYEAFKSIIINTCSWNKPLPIISINGNTRSGKSFLMNFFLHSDATIDGKHIDLSTIEGFVWEASYEHVTTGIWIWSKPVFTMYENQKIDVLLMDCQGFFDRENTTRGNEVLFWISNMLSSTFMYNVKEQLSLEKLEFLDSFISSAHATYKKADMIPPKFVIVLRDWECDHQFPLGMHKMVKEDKKVKFNPKKNNYLDYFFFDHESVSPQNQKTLANILASFPTVEACLLPHPGLDILKAILCNQNRVSIRAKFIEYAQLLVKDQLSTKIFVKNCKGKSITGDDLLQIGNNIANLLKSVPPSETLALKDIQIAYEFQLIMGQITEQLDKFLSDSNIKTVETLQVVYHQLREDHLRNLETIDDADRRCKHQEMLSIHMDKTFAHHLQKLLDSLKTSIITNYNCELLVADFSITDTESFTKYSEKYLIDFQEDTQVLQGHGVVKQCFQDLKNILQINFDEHLLLKIQSLKLTNVYVTKIHMENVRVLQMEFLLKTNEKYRAYIDENNLPEIDVAKYQKQNKMSMIKECIAQFIDEAHILDFGPLLNQYVVKLETSFSDKYNVITNMLVPLYGAIQSYNRGLLKLDLFKMAFNDFEEKVISLKRHCIEQAKKSLESVKRETTDYDYYEGTLEKILNRFYDCHLERLIDLLGMSLIDQCNNYMLGIGIETYNRDNLAKFEADIADTLLGKTGSLPKSDTVKNCILNLQHQLETCFTEHKEIRDIVVHTVGIFNNNIFKKTLARLSDDPNSATQNEPVQLCINYFEEKTSSLLNTVMVQRYRKNLDAYISSCNSEALTNLINLQNEKEDYNRSMSVTHNPELTSTLMKQQHNTFSTKCQKMLKNILSGVQDENLVHQYSRKFRCHLAGMKSKHMKVFVDDVTQSTTAELKREAFNSNIFITSSWDFSLDLGSLEARILKDFVNKTSDIEGNDELIKDVQEKLTLCGDHNRKLYRGCRTAMSQYISKLADEDFACYKPNTAPKDLLQNGIYLEYIETFPKQVSLANDRIASECKNYFIMTKPRSDQETLIIYQEKMNKYLNDQGYDVQVMTKFQKHLLERYFENIVLMREDEMKRLAFMKWHYDLKETYVKEFSRLSKKICDKKLLQTQLNHFKKSMELFYQTHSNKRRYLNSQKPLFSRLIRWFQGY